MMIGSTLSLPDRGRGAALGLAVCGLMGAALLTGKAPGRGSWMWKPVTQEDLKITAAQIGEPEADAGILFREGELDDDDAEGTSLRVYVRIKIFDDRGRRYGDVQLPYRDDLGRITEVHARTVRPDGTAMEVENRDIFDKLLATSGRTVWRAKTFSMPKVEAGSIIEYRYRQLYPAGFRYFALDLQSELFIKELVYHINPHWASPLDMRWVVFNAAEPSRFVPTWQGSYTIKASNIPPFQREPLMPPEDAVKIWGWLYYSKETANDVELYWKTHGRKTYFKMIDETKNNKAIKRVLDAITLPGDTSEQKIERIYNYVQTEIRNVADVSEDTPLLRHTASSAEETLDRRYGTPSEINTLFIAMLRSIGLDARVAELTTRDENFFRRSFPDELQFNAEVAVLPLGPGEMKFYDPGSEMCPIGMLSWEKEGVPALLADRDAPQFVVTPVTEPAESNSSHQFIVKLLPDGQGDVQADLILTGQRALEYRRLLKGLGPQQGEKVFSDSVREDVPRAFIDDSAFSVTGMDDWSRPLKIHYHFVAPSFASPTEKRLLLRPAFLARKDSGMFQAGSRTNSVYFHYPWSETDHVEILSPSGFAPEQLPQGSSLDLEALKYHSAFRSLGNRVIYDRGLTVNGFLFDPSQYPTLKSFFDRVHQADTGIVSLRH